MVNPSFSLVWAHLCCQFFIWGHERYVRSLHVLKRVCLKSKRYLELWAGVDNSPEEREMACSVRICMGQAGYALWVLRESNAEVSFFGGLRHRGGLQARPRVLLSHHERLDRRRGDRENPDAALCADMAES